MQERNGGRFMWLFNKKAKMTRKGIALVAALLFVIIFSAISVGMFTLSTNNVVVAKNLHTANDARAAAESGLEVIRHYMSQVEISGLTPESARYSALLFSLYSSVDNTLPYTFNEDLGVFTLGSADAPITLSSTTNRGFTAEITPDGVNGVNICVTGQSGEFERTIYCNFTYGVRQNSVFDYGVATKGPLSLGNLLLDGVNVSVEADVYIESLFTTSALDIQNAQIAGDVSIVNPDAVVTMSGGQSSIGGETGQAAIDNHVEVGVESTEFPMPNPTYFEQYVNGVTIDSSTDSSFYKTNAVLENVRIAAGTNPKFTADTHINGILYIESPNVVEFGGNCNVNGLIIAEGDYDDNSGVNKIDFQGTVSSQSVATLPTGGIYDGLQGETGTFLLAPGFAVSFGGNFDILNGCIAANGVRFYGHAGGEIGGSIVNYSDTPMDLSGSDLLFNRSGIEDLPAGFIPEIVIHYDPESYEEIL